MRRYLPKSDRRGVLGFNTPRSEPKDEPDEDLEEAAPESCEEQAPCAPEDADDTGSETALRMPWFGPGRGPAGPGRPGCPPREPGCPPQGPGCPNGPNWPPWCPGNPPGMGPGTPCPPGMGPGVPCPPGGMPLATAWVPWQVYNGYVHPCEMAGSGTIFPELLRCPPLYQKPPGT